MIKNELTFLRNRLIIRQPQLRVLRAMRYLQLNTSTHVRNQGFETERWSVHGLAFANCVLAP